MQLVHTPVGVGSVDAVSGASAFNSVNAPSAGAAPSFGASLAGGVSLGMAIGQAVGSIYSAYSLGKSLKYQLETQAKIDKINARIQQMGAETAYRRGEAEVARITMRAGQIKAKQNVAYAANGVATGYGSAAAAKASTSLMKELDVHTANMNALAAAWGYQQEAVNMRNASFAHMAQGTVDQGRQNTMAMSTLVGSIGEIHERWNRFKGE